MRIPLQIGKLKEGATKPNIYVGVHFYTCGFLWIRFLSMRERDLAEMRLSSASEMQP